MLGYLKFARALNCESLWPCKIDDIFTMQETSLTEIPNETPLILLELSVSKISCSSNKLGLNQHCQL